MSRTLDAALLERWAAAAVAALEGHRAEIDRINVFPVADRDTGTNMLLTMRAAAAGCGRDDALVAAAETLARGALLGARGNSGVILSQVLRGVAEAVAAAEGPCAGAVLADALDRGARLAEKAVTRPQEGTVLTVLAAAADGAAAARSDRLDAVAVAAVAAARTALRATPDQLPELGRAGVVDAGGFGLVVVLDALAALVTGRAPADAPDAMADTAPLVGAAAGGHARRRRPAPAPTAGPATRSCTCSTAPTTGGPPPSAPHSTGSATRWPSSATVPRTAAGSGTCTCTARTSGPRWRPGWRRAGRTASGWCPWSTASPDAFPRARAVLAVVCGPETAELARAAGADVLVRDCPPPGDAATDADEALLAEAVAGTGARHVALVTCDAALTPAAERVAGTARRAGQEVVVVPSASVVAGSGGAGRARSRPPRGRRRRRHDRGGRGDPVAARCRSPTRRR